MRTFFRSTRATYAAAFLLGVLIALLLVVPARSAVPTPAEPPLPAANG